MSINSMFQQAQVHIDNQHIQDNLKRVEVIKGLVLNVQIKDGENKPIQTDTSKTIQPISTVSKG